MVASKRSLLLAIACAALCPAGALAENWTRTPPNSYGMTTMYDADSVYLERSSGLVYATTCGDPECTTSKPGELFGPETARVDCTAKTWATNDEGRWGAPSHLARDAADLNHTYQPETEVAMTIAALCAQKDSWPKR